MSVFWSVCRLSQFLSITRIQREEKIKRGTGVSLSDIFLSYNYTFFFSSVCLCLSITRRVPVSVCQIFFCHVIIHFFFSLVCVCLSITWIQEERKIKKSIGVSLWDIFLFVVQFVFQFVISLKKKKIQKRYR